MAFVIKLPRYSPSWVCGVNPVRTGAPQANDKSALTRENNSQSMTASIPRARSFALTRKMSLTSAKPLLSSMECMRAASVSDNKRVTSWFF